MRRLKSSFLEYTDEALMKALTQGEKSAFDELYARYSSKLFGYFMKMLWNNRIRSEDLLQDLFAKIISQPHLFDPSRNFKTWVYAVAANMCIGQAALTSWPRIRGTHCGAPGWALAKPRRVKATG
jgi:RNA polymerase sigma-70 factor (ECF subfamily)